MGHAGLSFGPLALQHPNSNPAFSILDFVQDPQAASPIMTGIDLPCEARVGARFTIEYFGDIIISGDAQFGDDCRIRNGVTVVLKRTSECGSPVIGNRVDIGTGAKVLGAITVGDDVAIGANAVVTKAVPANSTAVAVPAVIKPRVSPAESDTTSTPPASTDV